MEPKSVRISLDGNETSKLVQFKCRPPLGVPEPVVFWMRNDVIILESEKSHSTFSGSAPLNSSQEFSEQLIRKKKNFANKQNKIVLPESIHREERQTKNDEDEDDEDEEDEDYEDDDDEDSEYDGDGTKQTEKKFGNENNSGDLLLPNQFDLAAENLPSKKDGSISINYRMADDYSLIIKRITMDDQANYTCGAYNVAGVRFAALATLTIFGKPFSIFPIHIKRKIITINSCSKFRFFFSGLVLV